MREKVVFYETQKEVWLIEEKYFNREQYEKERNITRFCICNITRQAQELLFSLLEDDKEMRDDIIREELDNNPETLYTN